MRESPTGHAATSLKIISKWKQAKASNEALQIFKPQPTKSLAQKVRTVLSLD